MQSEFRRRPRVRTFLTATIRDGDAVTTAMVKDFSGAGAKLKFGATVHIPEEFKLTVSGRPEQYLATCVWRDADTMGVRLTLLAQTDQQLERRVRIAERERKVLLAKLERLNTGW